MKNIKKTFIFLSVVLISTFSTQALKVSPAKKLAKTGPKIMMPVANISPSEIAIEKISIEIAKGKPDVNVIKNVLELISQQPDKLTENQVEFLSEELLKFVKYEFYQKLPIPKHMHGDNKPAKTRIEALYIRADKYLKAGTQKATDRNEKFISNAFYKYESKILELLFPMLNTDSKNSFTLTNSSIIPSSFTHLMHKVNRIGAICEKSQNYLKILPIVIKLSSKVVGWINEWLENRGLTWANGSNERFIGHMGELPCPFLPNPTPKEITW